MFYKKQKTRLVAEWWYYDTTDRQLYCEVLQGDKPIYKKLTCIVMESDVENAWLAISEKDDEHILLWKDKEFSPDNELVAEVNDWEITLRGHYKDGALFEEGLRLFVPLQNGSAIAIGKSRNREYYLKKCH